MELHVAVKHPGPAVPVRLIAAFFLAAAGCGGSPESSPDALMPDAPAPDASPQCDPERPFDSVVPLDGFATLDLEGVPRLTPDERTLIISVSTTNPANYEILWALT